MTDKETLILAAKAAGYIVHQYDEIKNALYIWGDSTYCWWSSTESNDDCFRMETALGLNVNWNDELGCVEITFSNVDMAGLCEYFADHNGDKDKARRYASTRAAALEGRE